MERDEIIEMARKIATEASKVGPYRTWTHEHAMSLIMRLVEVSAAKERDACAKVCGKFADEALACGDEDAVMCFEQAEDAIKARGQA